MAEVTGLIFCSPEVIAQTWLDPLRGSWSQWTTFITTFFSKNQLLLAFWPSKDFLPQTVPITSVLKNHVHLTMQWKEPKRIRKRRSVLKSGGGCYFLSFMALLRMFYQIFTSYCKFIRSKALKWCILCLSTLIFL